VTPDPILSVLTEDERTVLVAGLETSSVRTPVWVDRWPAVKHLGRLNLIEWARQQNANGDVEEIPLCLTDHGVRLAEVLAERG
jgi:hypothetical protein